MRKDYYWDPVSKAIGKILYRVFSKDMSICEIGFSSGHFLEWLNDNGYKFLSGIEIREDPFVRTQKKFKDKNLNINLHFGDVLEYSKSYDGIFATGLIQCLDSDYLHKFLTHVSQIADIAIFTAPKIAQEGRNQNSGQLTAVSGCHEYATGNIPYELSKYYDIVRTGTIDKKSTHLDDTIIYYICSKQNLKSV